MTNSDALRNATFGIPWQSFWALASEEQQASLLGLIALVKNAGATVINGTELPDYQTIVSPDGWNWYVGVLFPVEALFLIISAVGIMERREDIRMNLNSRL